LEGDIFPESDYFDLFDIIEELIFYVTSLKSFRQFSYLVGSTSFCRFYYSGLLWRSTCILFYGSDSFYS